MVSVPGLSTALGLAFAFQANSTDVDDVTLAILHLHENEFLDSLKREWWEYKDECPKKQDTSKDFNSFCTRIAFNIQIMLVLHHPTYYLVLRFWPSKFSRIR